MKCCWFYKKVLSLVHTSDVLIIQLLISKHENSVSQKLKPNLIVNEEITIFRNTMKQHDIILHEEEQYNGHYTANIRVNEICYAISDTHVSLQSSFISYRKEQVP